MTRTNCRLNEPTKKQIYEYRTCRSPEVEYKSNHRDADDQHNSASDQPACRHFRALLSFSQFNEQQAGNGV